MLLTKTTAAKNEVALSYHRARGLKFLAVIFVAIKVLKVKEDCFGVLFSYSFLMDDFKNNV